MSEEEIKEFLNKYKDCKCDLREYNSCIECENKVKQAIQGLLDLYNKEKRKHQIDLNNYKGLIADVSTIAEILELEEDAPIDGIIEKINKEKEKNKKLIEGKFREVADKNSYIKDNYVSKDKIRELLEDVNETLEYAKNNDLVDTIFFINCVKNSLEKLLEEENV